MLEKKYTKAQVINKALSITGLGKIDYEAYEKRLQVIIEFLNEERVKYILEQENDRDLGSYFYNQEMNITKAEAVKTDDKFPGYNYNLLDLIFLGVLLIEYHDPYFKRIRIGSTTDNPDEKGEKLLQVFSSRLKKYKSLWEEEGDGRTWSIISTNLQYLFYRITMIDTTKTAASYRKILDELMEKYEELPAHHQIAFYEDSMKTRVNTIGDKLEEYIENMKKEQPNEYSEYLTHKKLVEIDRNIENDHKKSKTLKDLMKELRSEYYKEEQ